MRICVSRRDRWDGEEWYDIKLLSTCDMFKWLSSNVFASLTLDCSAWAGTECFTSATDSDPAASCVGKTQKSAVSLAIQGEHTGLFASHFCKICQHAGNIYIYI